MYTKSFKALSLTAMGLLFGLAASQEAFARCGCPEDGHGQPKLSIGLGESYPLAADLAADPAWAVYEFERDGVRYVQVNDELGDVRAAVGRIDDTFWVMPIGSDADRVAVPGDAAPTGQGVVLARTADTVVIRYRSGGQTRWVIRAP